jgi:hypothetical protein
MQTPQRKLKDIKRLLAAFPPVNGDPALVLHNYLMAVEDWAADFVEDGVTLILKGKLPGHDGRFAPTPPMVATACRMSAEASARAQYLNRLKTPALPAPDIKHTPEERARAKAKVQAFIEGVAAADLHVTTEERKRQQERWEKVNAHFDPPQDDESLTDRLHLRRGADYSVGAPESDDAAA